jgi:nucleoside-diphosphate-sugar epimerase
MRMLVLGGTAFVGRQLVAAALGRGHEITLFTRGRTNPELFPDAEHVVGDRERDLALLSGREFDAVLDTCGYLPRVVRASADALAGRIGLYAFVSSISVYEDVPAVDELSVTRRPVDPGSEDVAAEYGGLKALCEDAVESAVGDRTLVIRPGLIVGPHDYTGRFSYWPRRLARGGEVLAPGPPATRVWFVDVRDLASWTIGMVERGAAGTYNAVGPLPALTIGELLDQCRAAAGSDACPTWVTDEFLLEHGVAPYTELPLWIPAVGGGHPVVDVGKAIAAGLSFRPVGETIRSILEEAEDGEEEGGGRSGPLRPRAGLAPGREQELLEAWHASCE